MGRKTIGTAALLAAGTAVVVATPGLASHSWANYHWERSGSNEITVPIIDHTTGIWAQRNHVAIAVADWNESPVIQSPLTKGGPNTSCPIVAGEIHVCNDDYGNTGWVGIASISATRGRTTHIIGGVTKLNDYYFNQPFYNNDVWRQLVTCQEIGHDYGLGHQNEDFRTDDTDSCMEYTSDPTNNTGPDSHDYQMLLDIYAHSHGGDGGDTGGPGGGKGKPNKFEVGNRPADWGTAIGFDRQGRANVYKRSMDSFDVITHVTWAIGEEPQGDHHDHADGPRRHKGDRHF